MNIEFLGLRRRALEEEYFAKVNRALRDKLRGADASEGKSPESVPTPEPDGATQWTPAESGSDATSRQDAAVAVRGLFEAGAFRPAGAAGDRQLRSQ